MTARVLIIFFVLSTTPVWGTHQIPDEMNANGEIHYVYGFTLSYEMSDYFYKFSNIYDVCSANWDGYKATLTIKGNKLFIVKLDVGCEFLYDPDDYRTPDPAATFGVQIPHNGLFAEWFTGELDEYFGEQIREHIKSNVRVYYFTNGILTHIEEKESEMYKKLKPIMEEIREEQKNANKRLE